MGFRLRLPSRTLISRWTIYALFAGLFITFPTAIFTAPAANAATCNPISSTIGSDTVLTFSNVENCDWTVPNGVSLVRFLVVGGGGAGGGGWTTRYFGNGGGGGEVIESITSVIAGSSINISVGAGGAPTAYDANSTSVNNGQSSIFGTSTARGGKSTADRTTRVGGASGNLKIGGTGSTSATEGGGGGGSAANGAGRNGGAGTVSDISGTSIQYGGGGASMGFGASPVYGTATGGGGVPATYNTNVKGNGTANTGGGGGGDNGVAGGGAGGSGLVIVRYTILDQCTSTTSTVDTQTVLTFTTAEGCDWTVPSGVTSVRVLVVGGGSSGGAGLSGVWWPQGGGGGAVVSQLNFSTTPLALVRVVVGAGGEAITTQSTPSTSINNGGQSRFATITANGGVAPVNTLAAGVASGNGNAGGGTSGGYSSGGGGGAGASGSGLNGGAGVNSNITGVAVMYGSGGAGANGSSGTASSGGGSNDSPPSANRGGGGSQPTANTGTASAGAAGVVIVRYTTPINPNPVLSFNANGGSGSIAARSETIGATTTLPSGSGLTKRNSVATGWNTAANGSGTPYAFGDPYTFSVTQTLYLQWSGPVLTADLASPRCVAGVGVGGPNAAAVAGTKAGNGCVVVEYTASGTQAFKSFNYTGDTQTWTVPTGVSSVIFYAIGAGGGGSFPTGAQGGGGGFAKGQLGVNAGDIFSIIVGQGGGGVAPVAEGACFVTNRTFGGGGRGGSCAQNGYSGQAFYQAAGGGRSAVRIQGGANDLITAAGGGGGSYGGQGGAGGGYIGVTGGAPNPGTGATQSAGGTGGFSVNNIPGFAG
jgi:hypothetical protein